MFLFFFFKQKTAYELRISDWSSDVCSSDLPSRAADRRARLSPPVGWPGLAGRSAPDRVRGSFADRDALPQRAARGEFCRVRPLRRSARSAQMAPAPRPCRRTRPAARRRRATVDRSEEHTPELQSLLRISYAAFCLKTKNTIS